MAACTAVSADDRLSAADNPEGHRRRTAEVRVESDGPWTGAGSGRALVSVGPAGKRGGASAVTVIRVGARSDVVSESARRAAAGPGPDDWPGSTSEVEVRKGFRVRVYTSCGAVPHTSCRALPPILPHNNCCYVSPIIGLNADVGQVRVRF